MAAPYNPPVKNEDFVFYVELEDMANSGSFLVDPTLAVGDVKIKLDTAAPTNITTLPSVDTAGESQVRVALTAAEMNAENVVISFKDQTSDKEWADFSLSIPTTA